MSNVTPLPTQRVISQQSAVDVLERYLELAKAGQITSVALAAVTLERNAAYCYSEPEDGLAMLGAVRLLDRLLATALDGEAV
jgi:hypothetical protein